MFGACRAEILILGAVRKIGDVHCGGILLIDDAAAGVVQKLEFSFFTRRALCSSAFFFSVSLNSVLLLP